MREYVLMVFEGKPVLVPVYEADELPGMVRAGKIRRTGGEEEHGPQDGIFERI